MSSWPGTVIFRWRISASSRVEVSKASASRFVSWTVYPPYPPPFARSSSSVVAAWQQLESGQDLCGLYPHPRWWTRRPSFSSRRCMDLEQSSAAYHICSVTSCLLLSLEDILLRTLLPVIIVVVPAKWHCHLNSFMDTLIALIYLP